MVSPLTRLGGLSSFLGVSMGLLFGFSIIAAGLLCALLDHLFPGPGNGR